MSDEPHDTISELLDTLDNAMRSLCCLRDTGPWHGWYDTLSTSTPRDIGDLLVKQGLWEQHPNRLGRYRFYRPIAKEPKP